MKSLFLAVGFLFSFSFSLSAAHTITSITPSESSVAGGDEIVVKGTGFTSGARVAIGGIPAYDVRVDDSSTIRIQTPAHLPGGTYLDVSQDGQSVRRSFRYAGDATDAFERFLLPIFSAPVTGPYGTLFQTRFVAWSSGNAGAIPVYGLYVDDCILGLCPPVDPAEKPVIVDDPVDDERLILHGNPGVFVYVPKSAASSLSTTLRVYEATHETAEQGAEIRVVRSNELHSDRTFGFPQVRLDPTSRITLRIYSTDECNAIVRIDGEEHRVALRKPWNDIYTPAYASFTEFPGPERGAINIAVRSDDAPGSAPIWAFVTITDNQTQRITTMHPN